MRSSQRHRQRVTMQNFKLDGLDLQICGSRRNRQFQRAVLKSLRQLALRSIVEQDVDLRKSLLKRGQRWRQYFNGGRWGIAYVQVAELSSRQRAHLFHGFIS